MPKAFLVKAKTYMNKEIFGTKKVVKGTFEEVTEDHAEILEDTGLFEIVADNAPVKRSSVRITKNGPIRTAPEPSIEV